MKIRFDFGSALPDAQFSADSTLSWVDTGDKPDMRNAALVEAFATDKRSEEYRFLLEIDEGDEPDDGYFYASVLTVEDIDSVFINTRVLLPHSAITRVLAIWKKEG